MGRASSVIYTLHFIDSASATLQVANPAFPPVGTMISAAKVVHYAQPTRSHNQMSIWSVLLECLLSKEGDSSVFERLGRLQILNSYKCKI